MNISEAFRKSLCAMSHTLPLKDRTVRPVEFPPNPYRDQEELERRHKAVARWRSETPARGRQRDHDRFGPYQSEA
jgi:hypothetical protein